MEQNLSQYRIFFEVAKAGNISKAAKILYISQPAISKAISKLEDGLGITLFKKFKGCKSYHGRSGLIRAYCKSL